MRGSPALTRLLQRLLLSVAALALVGTTALAALGAAGFSPQAPSPFSQFLSPFSQPPSPPGFRASSPLPFVDVPESPLSAASTLPSSAPAGPEAIATPSSPQP